MDILNRKQGTAEFPIHPLAEHGDTIAAAVSQADGVAWPEFPEPDEDEIPVLLTAADFHKAYDAARLLWRRDMVRVLKGGLIFYNGIYPLAEVLLNVYDYLSKQTAATTPQKAGK